MSLQKHQNWRSWLKQSQLLKTTDQNWWSWLKQSKLWKPLLPLVVVGLFLILFKAEILFESKRQGYYWKVDARDWTGFGQSYDNDVSEVTEKGTETTGTTTKQIDKTTTTAKRLQPAKTLWDWAQLFLAPATLALLGFRFQYLQEKAKREKEEADKARDREKEEANKARDREKEEADKARVADQQREQALQTYFDQLSALLVDKQLKKLLVANQATLPPKAPTAEGADLSVVAETVTTKPELSIDTEAALNVVKARTLSLIRMFDEDIPRKASVLSFLGDADLLNQLDLDLSGIRLEGANLKKVNFSACNLHGAVLNGADLSDADLSDAKFASVNFQGAKLISTNFRNTNLSRAILNCADLRSAELRFASLDGANLSRANLDCADLSDTNLSNTNLSNTILSSVELSDAVLNHANLRGANLSGANLSGANLSFADLRDADLSGAILHATDLSAARLSGAILDYVDLRDIDLRSNSFWNDGLTGADLDRAEKDAVARIQSAENWQEARYKPKIRELLGLPSETSKAKADDQNTAS